MTYGKGFKVIINFSEYADEGLFEKELIKLIRKHAGALFIEGTGTDLG